MVLLNPPSVLTSLQLKAEEGLVSLVIWVRVKMALIFLVSLKQRYNLLNAPSKETCVVQV